MKFMCSWQQMSNIADSVEEEGPLRSLLSSESPPWMSAQTFFHYQPIVNLNTGEIRGCEALVRAKKIRGDVSVPANFLNRLYYAEREKIIAFDRYVLSQNIDFLVRMHASGCRKRLSINISGISFLGPESGPLEFVVEKLGEVGALGLIRYIDLEIVEWMEFKITDAVMDRVQACRDAGMGVCLDDAGTGSIGLDTFVALPFSCLKIDRIFVQKMAIEEKAFYVVKGFTETAKNLNIRVVAEGVETSEQVEILQELGVEFAQGYYFYTPMSGDEYLSICQRKM